MEAAPHSRADIPRLNFELSVSVKDGLIAPSVPTGVGLGCRFTTRISVF